MLAAGRTHVLCCGPGSGPRAALRGRRVLIEAGSTRRFGRIERRKGGFLQNLRFDFDWRLDVSGGIGGGGGGSSLSGKSHRKHGHGRPVKMRESRTQFRCGRSSHGVATWRQTAAAAAAAGRDGRAGRAVRSDVQFDGSGHLQRSGALRRYR